jgi:type II restriction enzyme
MMDLHFNLVLAENYKSGSQRSRVITEDWVAHNSYCPICGNPILRHYENNRPVADFCCDNCKADFELKSKNCKNGNLGHKVTDGEYSTMISRITSLRNPNFFFMTYNDDFDVNNFIFVPNHFFVPDIIEARAPLAETARRAGWTGCNILVDEIPDSGKIYIVKNSAEIDKHEVLANYQRIEGLKTNNLNSRGWLLDVLGCIDKLKSDDFTLDQMYSFDKLLKTKHPENNFVRDKIRQQLQLLRDKGLR